MLRMPDFVPFFHLPFLTDCAARLLQRSADRRQNGSDFSSPRLRQAPLPTWRPCLCILLFSMGSTWQSDQIVSGLVSDNDSRLPGSTEEVTDAGSNVGESLVDTDSALGDDS